MNLYLLKRTDHVGYDETAGFVIRADTVQRAQALANAKDYEDYFWAGKSVDITLIGTSQSDVEEIILQDYRAG